MDATQSVRAWHRLVESGDPGGLDELLAEDVVFHSPIVHSPQEGKGLTRLYLTAAFHVLFNEQFRYVREIVADDCAALEFTTEIDGVHVNGIDLIQFDDAGKIVDFKVMVRPLRAIQLVHGLMRKMLEQGSPAQAQQS